MKERSTREAAILGCLVFSGLSALVYQLIWTRLLGLAFGTNSVAIGTVLAVFFGGLALGNLAAARGLGRIRRPLRVYAWLEAGIGLWALLSLPLLWRLGQLFAWTGVPESALAGLGIRGLAAAGLLLPPTVAMGATLPVVARGLVREDGRVGRWSAHLYAANTFGAVAGAYACGFWLIPRLGLTRSLLLASAVNLGVAFVVGRATRREPVIAIPPDPARGDARAGDEVAASHRPAPTSAERVACLACFGISGFVAIGYEIVWSKVFAVVMEGTLYGFAAVLTAYLLGIALGSLAIARRVDGIRDLPRAFALLHVAIGALVVLGTSAVPYLPFAYNALARLAPAGDAIHLLYLLVLPIVLAPTALFGAAFPLLIRLDAPRAAQAARSVGIATAVNTAGSIAASLLVGFWWIPAIGMDASLYALLLLDFAAAIALLAVFQRSAAPVRLRTLGGALAVVGTLALSFGGVHIEQAIAGRRQKTTDFDAYLRGLARDEAGRTLTIEGRNAIVSVYETAYGRSVRTNGAPEAGMRYQPPYLPLETTLLGAWPFALAREADRALVIGLGGGNTLAALERTPIGAIDVVELEQGMTSAVLRLHAGRPDPLRDPRVSLRIADGRNDLLLRDAIGAPKYDLITSQPSHPWRVGAANLFTEEFFRLGRRNLREGGIFATWLNAFRIDAASLLAVVASFERVFPGALLIDVSKDRTAFLLVGSTEPVHIDLARLERRLAESGLPELLAPYDAVSVPDLLARVIGPAQAFAAIDPEAANTDDNAFVETRTPRALRWDVLDLGEVESRLAPDAPLLPPLRGEVDALALARALLSRDPDARPWPHGHALARLLHQLGPALDPFDAAWLAASAALRDPRLQPAAAARLEALAKRYPDRPEPLRTLGYALAEQQQDLWGAAHAFADAWARSGDARDAYDAGRALHPLDREAARRWFDRIPQERRGAWPRLAFYDAWRALDAGLRGEALRPFAEALEGYLDTEEGRRYPGAQALAGRIAWELGDEQAARAHLDADAAQRTERAAAAHQEARAALARGDLDTAERALADATRERPGDPELAALGAELALARRQPVALETALARLRRLTPSLREGVRRENAFRSRHGLPLLPTPLGGPVQTAR